MRVEVSVPIAAPRSVVWQIVTDIEGSTQNIPAVESVELLERPETGLVGLKWRETRTIFGKSATETMWITGAEEGSHYTTEARSHGSIYRTVLRLSDLPEGTRLAMEFSAEPVSTGARVMSFLFGLLIRRAMRGALQRDLEAIRDLAESRAGRAALESS